MHALPHTTSFLLPSHIWPDNPEASPICLVVSEVREWEGSSFTSECLKSDTICLYLLGGQVSTGSRTLQLMSLESLLTFSSLGAHSFSGNLLWLPLEGASWFCLVLCYPVNRLQRWRYKPWRSTSCASSGDTVPQIDPHWLVSVDLTQTEVTWREGSSAGKLPSSDWPVGKSGWPFSWLRVGVGGPSPWWAVLSLGRWSCVAIGSWTSYRERACKHHSSTSSASVLDFGFPPWAPVLTFLRTD